VGSEGRREQRDATTPTYSRIAVFGGMHLERGVRVKEVTSTACFVDTAPRGQERSLRGDCNLRKGYSGAWDSLGVEHGMDVRQNEVRFLCY
jgi:hypothetical protein